MSSNSCTVKPVKDVKSNGFLDSLSYESKERTRNWWTADHIAVYSNYARDLLKEQCSIKDGTKGFDDYFPLLLKRRKKCKYSI